MQRSRNYEAAQFLFKLLDDIDTASDVAKDDDGAYRAMVSKIQRRRFEVATTDGYSVTFTGSTRDSIHDRALPYAVRVFLNWLFVPTWFKRIPGG